jgi:hypothetical protein
MDRYFPAVALLALFILPFGIASESAQTEKRPPAAFRSLVKPQGWELPKHGKAKSRKLFDSPDGQMRGNSHVYASELGSAKSMFLPWYYIEDERLMLYSFEFRIPNLLVLDFDKKPFRYSAEAVGRHVGMSAIATWTDRDGDGTFEEFRWASSPIEDLPQWVTVR